MDITERHSKDRRWIKLAEDHAWWWTLNICVADPLYSASSVLNSVKIV
jgi:hypothetical protein